MLNKQGIDWIWNSIVESVVSKLSRCAINGKKSFKCTFKHICLIVIKNKIICYNKQKKGNHQINLNLSNDKCNYNTAQKDGNCPSFLFDLLFFNGTVALIKRNEDSTIFRYYQCYSSYRSKMGSLTCGGKLKYKTQNVHTCWQK